MLNLWFYYLPSKMQKERFLCFERILHNTLSLHHHLNVENSYSTLCKLYVIVYVIIQHVKCIRNILCLY